PAESEVKNLPLVARELARCHGLTVTRLLQPQPAEDLSLHLPARAIIERVAEVVQPAGAVPAGGVCQRQPPRDRAPDRNPSQAEAAGQDERNVSE
ncbi:MAG: hypothetical protein L0170_08510, partial [Acidobacteria bacterium]|nr:hypothetical protein [Acidobacteriota bacterium]